MKILSYIQDLKVENKAGGCKYCLTAVKQYSKHEVTLCGEDDIDSYNFNDFDIIHTHALHKKFLTKFDAKLIFGMHGFGFSCPPGGLYCTVLNNFLEEPLTCLDCLGYLGLKTGGNNLKRFLSLAKKSDAISVDDKFMQEFYHVYNPFVMPLPLETDILVSTPEKEDYILYTGRLSFEKNPHGFINIINRTKQKAKMVVYDTVEDTMAIKSQYSDILSNPNIEIILNPTKSEMIKLVQRAKFVVLPYFFAEPFGVAAANSVLCGTPLIAFPYGNVRNMTHLLARTFDEMVKLIKMNDKDYEETLKLTLKKGDELRLIHKPENAIKVWDEVYETI